MFHWNRCVTWHCIETCIPSLEWFGPTVTKLCSVQGNPDAADDDNTADESNHYMSPFQAKQKLFCGLKIIEWTWKCFRQTDGGHSFYLFLALQKRNDSICKRSMESQMSIYAAYFYTKFFLHSFFFKFVR